MVSLASSTVVLPHEQWGNCAPEALNNDENFSISALSNELISHCLSFLHPRELASTRLVCRKWSDLSDVELEKYDLQDLEKQFPKLTVLDWKVWKEYINLKRHGLEVCDTLPPSKDVVIAALTELFAKLDIENDAGITLLAMPKGLSLESAENFSKTPLKGYPTNIRWISDVAKDLIRNIKVKKTYYVAITNSVLNGSRYQFPEDHEDLVHRKGCIMPSGLSMIALNLLTYITSSTNPPICLYSDYPGTLSRCEEKERLDLYCNPIFDFSCDYHVIVGLFSPDGLLVSHKIGHFNSLTCIGVAAMRKF